MIKLQPGTTKKIINLNIERLIREGYTREEAVTKAHKFAGISKKELNKELHDIVHGVDAPETFLY